MKAHRFLTIIVLFLTITVTIIITGCKYDVAEPLWDKDYQLSSSPVINEIEPQDGAAPGVNKIVIRGENFVGISSDHSVYFEIPNTTSLLAELVEVTTTSITVRRPNLVTQSAIIKINSDSAGLVVKYGPYRIDPVVEEYGSFLENLELRSVTVDNEENLYVTEALSRLIWKITPTGEKTVIDTASRPPTSAIIGPNGWLYILSQNRSIERVNLTTDELADWHRLSSNRQLRYGDFDSNGYLFAGGVRTDLWIIAPDSTSSSAGVYTQDSILSVRVYNNNVYLAVAGENGRFIYRHSIDASGNLGEQTEVLNWQETEFAARQFRTITFASDGTMFIGIDSTDPLLLFDPTTKNIDIFYKSILEPYCKQFAWGTGNYLYMISGNVAPAQQWTVFRVDMGKTSAP
jgi:hypothetical protein